MSIIASDNGKNFTPAPEGLHRAVCVDVVDLGMVDGQWGQRHKVRVVWQIEEINPETDSSFQVSKMYTLSLNEKASLRKDLETWRGRKFSGEELKGFDLEKLMGINCQVQIIHNLSDEGRAYGNVQAVIPQAKGMPLMHAKDYTRAKDRSRPQGTNGSVLNSLQEEPLPF